MLPAALPSPRSWLRRARHAVTQLGAVAVALAALALLWGAILVSLAAERAATLQATGHSVENLALAFQENMVRSFTALDQALLSLRRAYARNPTGFDIADWAESTAALRDTIVQIALTDRQGSVIAGTLTPPHARMDLSDRPYFQALRDSTSDELFISPPLTGRASGKQVVVLARKRLTADGSFAGIVFLSVETAFLARFYATVDLGPQGTIGLFGSDGIVRARAGGRAPDKDPSVGRSAAGSRLTQLLATAPAGTFSTVSVFDHVQRIFAYRRVRGFPLVVTVGIAEADALARFVATARMQYALGGVATGLGLAMLAMYLRRDAQTRRLQAHLRAQYEEKSGLLETTLQQVSQGILMVGPDRRVQICNQRAMEKLGLPAALLAGKPPITEVLRWLWARGEYADGGDDFDAWLRRFLATSDGAEHVYEHTRPNGVVLEIRNRPLPDGGVVRTYTDITARKLDERALRAAHDAAQAATRAKSSFLATMSHEIRSPLSGLLGVLELLRATRLDPEQARMAGMIDASGRMLLAVLNDVLDFSKIEAGALVIASEPTPLATVLEELVQPHVAPGRHKGVAVTLAVDPALPAWLRTDPLRLRQIVGNLLSNAMKFTAAGSVAVTATLLPGAVPRLRIRVRDTGIGMDADALARLFQPFMQADGSTTRKFGGTGLGLSISHKLAELLDGSLSVTSSPGAGSEFVLELPCRACSAPATAAAEVAAAPAAAWAGARALLVDDDPTNRWLGERQLRHLGFAVDIAEDGAAGLAAALAAPYDVIVTDLHMPRLDGVGLARGVRAAEDAARRAVPIIGLTADATAAQRERCQAAGMTAVALKPLTSVRLAALLAELFPTAAARDAVAPELHTTAPELRAVAFDSQIFLDLFEPGDAEGAAWLGEFLATAREQVAALAAAPADAQLAHRLAGAAFSVGAMLLGEAARALELAALAGAAAARLAALQAAVTANLAGAEAAIAAFLAGAAQPRVCSLSPTGGEG